MTAGPPVETFTSTFVFSLFLCFHVSKNKAQTKLASLAMNPSLCPRPVGSAPARRRSFCRRPLLTTSWATHQLTAAIAAQWVKSKTHSISDSLRRGRTGCSLIVCFPFLLQGRLSSLEEKPRVSLPVSLSSSLAQLHWNCYGATFGAVRRDKISTMKTGKVDPWEKRNK